MDHWSSQSSVARWHGIKLYHLILSILLIITLFFGYAWQYVCRAPLLVPESGHELQVIPGTSVRQLINNLHKLGFLKHPLLLRGYLMLSGHNGTIKAGEYKIAAGMTAKELLNNIVNGLVVQYSFTVVEGWQTAQLISALQQHPKIKVTLKTSNMSEIIRQLKIPLANIEGVFLPDTYFFEAGTTDVDFLRRAFLAMEQKLQQAWANRAANSVLSNPYQALILASIIEKETGLKSEYVQVAGVYTRRLAKRMKLQADPTVVYAYKNQLKGPLLRKHLKIDSPYNTYKNYGLPPTPIALPSAAAIDAALHPAPGDSLYFVATGTGGHVFSKSLIEHNIAVKNFYNGKK